MRDCPNIYVGLDKSHLPYYTTAQECIYGVENKVEFNFWTLPDSELIKLAKYYAKVVCKDNRREFSLENLRKAKDQAMIEHINITPYRIPLCKYAVTISDSIATCGLEEHHSGRHTYVF